jgi:alkylhydroperoxidase family enzyme
VEKQAEEALRRSDEAALYRDPDRLEEQRIWNAYTHQVSAAAWQQGNKSDEWVRRWREMIADRAAAENYGDSTAAIDARLLRHVGVPYPQLPGAAWDTADLLPATDRQTEYDRLTAKYGQRQPVSSPSTDAPKRRRRA